MKGVIFTEFMEMVEHNYGLAMVDDLIESSDLPSKGIYTSVGTYDHQEMVSLLTNLCKKTGTKPEDALRGFGTHLFNFFNANYASIMQDQQHLFQLLEQVEHHIHVEVLKLYPDAQLPRFQTEVVNPTKMNMLYQSDKHLAWLAVGLIEGAMQKFKQAGRVEVNEYPENPNAYLLEISLDNE